MSTHQRFHNVVKQFSVSKSDDGIIADLISKSLSTTTKSLLHRIPSSDLNPAVIRRVISNPEVPVSSCLSFFRYLQTTARLPQKPDFRTHVTLALRLFAVRRFAEAKNVLSAAVAANLRCSSVPEIDSYVCEAGADHRTRSDFFDMLFRVYTDGEKFGEALAAFHHMASHDLAIDERSCMVHLIELKRNSLHDSLLEFFQRMVESNVEIRVQAMTLAVQILCKKNQITRARNLMDDLMNTKGTKPNIYTYNSFIEAYMNRSDAEGVGEILAAVANSGIDFNVATYTLLIKWYQKIGKTGYAQKLFDEMREKGLDPDIHVYTSMISLHSRRRDIKTAFALFDESVEKGLKPTVYTYGALIHGACKTGNMEAAELVLAEMRTAGVDLNRVVLNTLIYGYCNRGKIDEAWRLHGLMEAKGFEPDVYAYHAIAAALCRSDRRDEARALLFSVFEEKGIPLNAHSYTTLIDAYGKDGNFVEAKKLFRDMAEAGEKPAAATFNALIDGYCKKGKIKEAHTLRSEMKGRGLIPDVFTYTSLIHGECIVGKTDNAVNLFREMQEEGIPPSDVTYTALIKGLSKDGREEEAFRLYEEMTEAGFMPGDIVYSSLVGSLHGS
ncbi:hypothetical protein M569_08518 [Genlisea aurea]|uniref:Pentacotripeptide-repeat region of PRORP domain-containing protein n=1 Tax=Genlisea aurea TaxID=192259 RepID=S8DST6_9LAMI|nr:hypothetical protein M569_08518 [Genlisea aurea]